MTLKELDKQFADGLRTSAQNAVHRYIQHLNVKVDIENYAREQGLNLTKQEIEKAADLYVYDCKYDCNLSYWDNISNVIDMAKESQ